MSNFISVAEARQQKGIRLVLTIGAPGPWGEAAKGLLRVRKIPFARVGQSAGEDNAELVAWTGIRNAPQIVDEEDQVIHAFSDLIYFAERRGEGPSLIPEGLADRIAMFGTIREIAGEGGFAWQRRMSLFEPIMQIESDEPNPAIDGVKRMAESYGYSRDAAERAPAHIAAILHFLDAMLAERRAAGSRFFVGDRLSALDIYWASFAGLVAPLSEDLCAMPGYLRNSYGSVTPIVAAATTSSLLAHRDFIYEEYLELPVRL